MKNATLTELMPCLTTWKSTSASGTTAINTAIAHSTMTRCDSMRRRVSRVTRPPFAVARS